MNPNDFEQKLSSYHEFFSIEHEFSVNITMLDAGDNVNFEQFLSTIPMPFKLATDMSSIDSSALRSLQNLGSSASLLVNFLNQQAQKVDLLIGYILSQQDDVQHRYSGIKFGGGGIKFTAPTAFILGELLVLKVFLLENNCAIYCYGEIIDIECIDEQYIHKVIFHFIREEDREILVRASLHEQAKQLQKLAKLRNQVIK